VTRITIPSAVPAASFGLRTAGRCREAAPPLRPGYARRGARIVRTGPEKDGPVSPEPRSIWLVRHASRRDFDDPGWAVHAARPDDPPLSTAGRREAEALAERLAGEGIAHLFCSPFLRCVETAAPIAGRLDLPIALEEGLSEWLNPAWFPAPPQTAPIAELAARVPAVDPRHASRGRARYGESGEEALLRAGDTARRLVEDFGGDLLLVGHGASVIGAAAGLLGIAPARVGSVLPEPPYGSLSRLAATGGGWRLALAADTAHLRGLGDQR
jgi:broad specificity phosphatase PhoE